MYQAVKAATARPTTHTSGVGDQRCPASQAVWRMREPQVRARARVAVANARNEAIARLAIKTELPRPTGSMST